MAEQNKTQEMIRSSLESIRAMVDANTVVGTPIETPSGTTIIPISKVSVGYASGGLDFANKNAAKNFGGGGGTGLSITPIAFLTVGRDAEVNLVHLGKSSSDIDKVCGLIEKSPDILEKIKDTFF